MFIGIWPFTILICFIVFNLVFNRLILVLCLEMFAFFFNKKKKKKKKGSAQWTVQRIKKIK